MAHSMQFRFLCEGFPDDKFEVVRFTGEEGISQLYRFDVDLLSTDADIDIDDLQDRQGTLIISGIEHERRVQGVATEVRVLDQTGGMAMYRVSLMPRLWHLSLSQANAVYLERTTPDVIKGTLEDQLGLTTTDFDMELETDYRDWPFRLQYSETYWDFLCRLMERDGIYYYFVTGEDGEKPVFCDSQQRQPQIDSPALPYTAGLGMTADERTMADGTIDSLVMHQRRLPQTVWVQNYNDDKPSTPIRRSAKIDPRGTGDINLYGQNVLDPTEATAVAGIRAEEIRAGKVIYHGSSTAFRFAAGYRFELTDHPRARHNQEYQLLTVEHSGHSPEATSRIGQMPDGDTPVYENRFTAIPADAQYRAPRTTDWPSIRGTLNAHVDASGDGQYAELDEEGRYHIVFPFHRGTADPGQDEINKLASHWLRMVQPYSGHREGMHFPLRKGTRVLVSFIGGNPDLPVIAGTLPDCEQPSVVRDDNQTRGRLTTPGGNELETDDIEGRERMRFSSRTARSSIRLGADQHYMLGGASAGAAAAYTPADDPDADGIEAETDGMARLAYFGGTNYLISAAAWSVKSTLWPVSQIARDDELALQGSPNGLLFIRNYESGQPEWRTADGLDRVFRFPRKHELVKNADPQAQAEWGEPTITANEEAYGRLLLSRTLGDEYAYRSGTTFSFQGIDREVFDFGPIAAFTFARHSPSEYPDSDDYFDEDPPGRSAGADVKNARQEVREALHLDDLDQPTGTQYDKAEQSLSAIRAGDSQAEADAIADQDRAALADLEDELAELEHDGRTRAWNLKSTYAPGFNVDHESTIEAEQLPHRDDNVEFLQDADFVFPDRSTLERWLQLKNYPVFTTYPALQNDIRKLLHSDTGDVLGYVVQETNLTAQSSPRSGSIEEAKNALAAATQAYEEARAKLRESAVTNKSNLFHNLDFDEVRHSRISYNKFHQFSWHKGVIYDFGGCWNYNIGNGYEETHIVSDPNGIDEHFDKSPEYDLLSTGGYGWIGQSDNPWTAKVDPQVRNADAFPSDNESIVVSKTFGATYDFQEGVALSSQQGPSLDVKQGGPNVSRTYSGDDQLAEHVISKDGITTTYRNHPVSGAPLFYSRETWGGPAEGSGKNSFSVEAAPSLSLDIKGSSSLATSIHASIATDISVDVGLKMGINVAVAGTLDFTFKYSYDVAYKIVGGAALDMDYASGVKVEITGSTAAKVKIDQTTAPVEVKCSAKATKLNLGLGRKVIELAAGTLSNTSIEIEGSTMTVSSPKGVHVTA